VSGADAFWDLYIDAIIEIEVDGGKRCVRGPDAASLDADAPLFVLTAYNPGGEDLDDARNEVAERALERELSSEQVTFWPALGRSRDASWSEPGVALAGVDRTKACAYGKRYGQLAIYELTEDEVHVIRCDDAEIVRTAPPRK
jgi:Protein of unknown function (DUF3293)